MQPLPFLLAGPILRRVEPRALGVWVALSRPSTVTLVVWEGLRKHGTPAAPILRSLPQHTLRVGEKLHVVLVAAQIESPAVPLQPGVNYAYDLEFEQDDAAKVEPKRRSLATEGLLGKFEGAPRAAEETYFCEAPLGYGAGLLPSFAPPPALLTDFKLIYGSCRLPANAHFDAMPWIDAVIDTAFADQSRNDGATLGTAAIARPHMLVLGGDQIYADDVSPLHLARCNRLAQQLISGTETPAVPRVETMMAAGKLVDHPAQPPGAERKHEGSVRLGRTPAMSGERADLTMSAFPVTLDCFPAGGRFAQMEFDGQFTSVDGASHLLSFGEFAAMYLTVFSDRFFGEWVKEQVMLVAREPRQPPAQALPLCPQSILDARVAGYFSASRWSEWNEIRPKDDGSPSHTKRLANLFAAHMLPRLARADLPAGFEAFQALVSDPEHLKRTNPELHDDLTDEELEAQEHFSQQQAAVFGALMRQLQGRVMRSLVRRFGYTKLCDFDCRFDAEDEAKGLTGLVLLHGPVALQAEARKREDAYKGGKPDRWAQHLDTLLSAENIDWAEFLKQALETAEPRPWSFSLSDAFGPEPRDEEEKKAALEAARKTADAPLGAALIEQLSLLTRWADDPTTEERAAFAESGYFNLGKTSLARCIAELAAKHVWPAVRGLHLHHHDLERYALGLPKVRRILANVPTYMIFDDHDVTDDWNLNPVWYRRVYATSPQRPQPFGRQVIRNALAAYAVFQDWGNDLKRYRDGDAGAQVLAAVSKLFDPQAVEGWPTATAVAQLDRLFGLDQFPQAVEASRPHGRHTSIDAPMKWHYLIDAPQCQVVVLDNRTRRGFAGRFGPPANVDLGMLEDQIPAAPMPAGREVLLVVAPLQVLAPSVFDEIVAPGSYRAFDLGAPGKVKSGTGGAGMPGLNPDAIESWALDALCFEALLARLAPHGKVVLLSGDVHNSTATQLSYWRRGQALPSRIAQFTSSGFKNVMPEFLTVIDHSLAFAQELIRVDIGGDRIGWLDGADDAFDFPPGKTLRDVPLVLRKRIPQRPAHLPIHGWPADGARGEDEPGARTRVRLQAKPPDFSWTLRPVFDVRADAERPRLAQPEALVGTAPDDTTLAAGGPVALAAYAQVATRHFRQLDRLGQSRQIFFRSNFARVIFERRSVDGRDVLEAVHQVMSALTDPMHPVAQPEVQNTHLLKPEVVMEQRAELTPPAGAVRPEERPLKGALGKALFG